MTAFDYKNQKWVAGNEAVRVRIAQIQEQLSLADSPLGERYAKFVGVPLSDLRASLNSELGRLQPWRKQAALRGGAK